MNAFRKVIRISNAYYVSVPKEVMARLRLFRGSVVGMRVEGSQIVLETDEAKAKKIAWEGVCT